LAATNQYDSTVGIQFVANVQDTISNLTRLDFWLGKIATQFKTIGVVAGVAGGIWAVAQSFSGLTEIGMSAEKQLSMLKTQLQGVAPAGKEAEMAMKEFKGAMQLTSETPFDMSDVINAAVSLRQVGIDPLTKSFKNFNAEQVAQGNKSLNAIQILGNAATAVGKDISEVMGGFQAATTGNFMSLDYSLGAEFEKARAGLSNLKAGTAAFNKKLLETIASIPRFQTGMSDLRKTLPGVMAELNKHIKAFFITLTGPFVKDQFSIYNQIKNTLSSIKDWFKENATGIRAVAMVLSFVLSVLWNIGRVLVEVVLVPFKALVEFFGELFEVTGNFADSYDRMSKSLEVLSEKLNALWRRVAVFFMGVRIVITDAMKSLLTMALKLFNFFYGDLSEALTKFGITLAILGKGAIFGAIQWLGAFAKSLLNVKNIMNLISQQVLVEVIYQIINMTRNGVTLNGVLTMIIGTVILAVVHWKKLAHIQWVLRKGMIDFFNTTSTGRSKLMLIIAAIGLLIYFAKDLINIWNGLSSTTKFAIGAITAFAATIYLVVNAKKAWAFANMFLGTSLRKIPLVGWIIIVIEAIFALIAAIGALIEKWEYFKQLAVDAKDWFGDKLNFSMSSEEADARSAARTKNREAILNKIDQKKQDEEDKKTGMDVFKKYGSQMGPDAVIPPGQANAMAVVPNMQAAAAVNNNQNVQANVQNQITVNAAPGMDTKEIANEVMKNMEGSIKQSVSKAMEVDKKMANYRSGNVGYAQR
jgi:hypothetical protein